MVDIIGAREFVFVLLVRHFEYPEQFSFRYFYQFLEKYMQLVFP